MPPAIMNRALTVLQEADHRIALVPRDESHGFDAIAGLIDEVVGNLGNSVGPRSQVERMDQFVSQTAAKGGLALPRGQTFQHVRTGDTKEGMAMIEDSDSRA